MAPILIEGRNLVLREGTGIATYAAGLAKALAGLGHELDILFDTDAPLSRGRPEWNEILLYDRLGRVGFRQSWKGRLREALELAGADPFGVDARPIAASGDVMDAGTLAALSPFQRRQAVTRLFRRADRHLLRYGRLLPVRPLRQPALFHATHPAAIRVAGCPNICTIHDLVPLRLPHFTLDNKRAYLKTLREIGRTADRILTVSEHSRADIVRLLGVDEARVVNAYQAVAVDPLQAEELHRVLAAFRLERGGYFLFVGAIEPKKNVERLIDAYLASGASRPLVIAGRLGWSYEGVLSRLESLGAIAEKSEPSTALPRILRLPYLPRWQVTALMQGARALLFPSLYEGFGLPAAEAMALGTAVMAGRAGSLPEIVGEAALLVDPLDTQAMARAMRILDEDEAMVEELARRGPAQAASFSPERFSERLGDLYNELI